TGAEAATDDHQANRGARGRRAWRIGASIHLPCAFGRPAKRNGCANAARRSGLYQRASFHARDEEETAVRASRIGNLDFVEFRHPHDLGMAQWATGLPKIEKRVSVA